MSEDRIGGCIIKETLSAIVDATSLLSTSTVIVDGIVRKKANANKIDGMISVEGDSFVFCPFQDRKRIIKVSVVNMKDFYNLVDLMKLRNFEKITDNVEKNKTFIAGILAGESVLKTIDKKMLEMCKGIICSCGVVIKKNFDNEHLKVHRSCYWNNLCQYVSRFCENDSTLSCVKDILYFKNVWTRSVCCMRICDNFINDNERDGFCTKCKQNLQFHVRSDVGMQLNQDIKINFLSADSSKIYNTDAYHELLYFYFL
jgi:hypothetical protein